MTDTIAIITEPYALEHNTPSEGTLSIGDFPTRQLSNIDVATLQQSLTNMTTQLNSIFESVQTVGKFELSQIEVKLEISAEGGIALIGNAKAGAKGAIGLTFKTK